jgi:Delta3-Delta2-enoyl-CoA isomerase
MASPSIKQLSAISVDTTQAPLAIITFTRPDRLNSFIKALYREIADSLAELDRDESVSVVLMRGSGRFYSSGADLSDQAKGMTSIMGSEPAEIRKFIRDLIWAQAHYFVKALIDFSKPIIAAVNGPAVGIAVTSLALCDIVYAAESATFNTPFMQFGFCAEGCSSVLFAEIMGTSKASELLLLGTKINANDAERCGLVSQVFSNTDFEQQVLERALQMAKFPPNALRQTKALMREPNRQRLHDTNDRELTLLIDRFMSEESANAVMQFMMQRQALRSKM